MFCTFSKDILNFLSQYNIVVPPSWQHLQAGKGEGGKSPRKREGKRNKRRKGSHLNMYEWKNWKNACSLLTLLVTVCSSPHTQGNTLKLQFPPAQAHTSHPLLWFSSNLFQTSLNNKQRPVKNSTPECRLPEALAPGPPNETPARVFLFWIHDWLTWNTDWPRAQGSVITAKAQGPTHLTYPPPAHPPPRPLSCLSTNFVADWFFS